jgi:hypothetical protein
LEHLKSAAADHRQVSVTADNSRPPAGDGRAMCCASNPDSQRPSGNHRQVGATAASNLLEPTGVDRGLVRRSAEVDKLYASAVDDAAAGNTEEKDLLEPAIDRRIVRGAARAADRTIGEADPLVPAAEDYGASADAALKNGLDAAAADDRARRKTSRERFLVGVEACQRGAKGRAIVKDLDDTAAEDDVAHFRLAV